VLIQYHLPHVFYPGSNKLLNARTLRLSMDYMVAMNRVFLEELSRSGAVPLKYKELYKSGIVYDRTVWWEPIPALLLRGYGDCKSLTAAWVAQARFFKRMPCRPVFRFVDNADGSTDYHILVELANGQFEDPSKVLGMGADEVAKFYGPTSY
jgi:hypothetical protein